MSLLAQLANDENKKSWMNSRLVRRILPLAVLASMIALAIVQFSKLVQSKIDLEFYFQPALFQEASLCEIFVQEKGLEQDLVSTVQFTWNNTESPPPVLRHNLSLTKGEYQLLIRLKDKETIPFLELEKTILVEGDAKIKISIP